MANVEVSAVNRWLFEGMGFFDNDLGKKVKNAANAGHTFATAYMLYVLLILLQKTTNKH